MPGLVIVNDEPQIRGGSGFSSGMGSRVMILLDNMPLLRPDAGRPMWSFIPLEDVSEIEVIKGAASVVYGSSALTGAINVHTAYATKKPRTRVTLFGGVYDSPKADYKKSWERVNPLKWGASFSHARIIKNDFDLVLVANTSTTRVTWAPNSPSRTATVTKGSTKDAPASSETVVKIQP